MAETWFTPKEWKARLVEFAGRRLLRNVANGESTTYDVSRSEGQVSQEGDAFNTKNMNDLEQRISNGFAKAKTNIDSLNRDLSAVPEFVIDKSTGKITGYKTKAGADTVFPFSAPLLNMKFSQMPKVNYYTSTNLVFENPGYNRLKVTDCNANYWWVYNSPNFDVNNWGNELDTKYQIGNRNDTVFDITNVKYVLIHTKQSENNNSGFGGCKFNLCNE
jgi:hypothetical protein